MSGRPMVGAVGPTGPVGPIGCTGANGPCGPVGGGMSAASATQHKWKLTPWWVFWRPKWCRGFFPWEQANGWRKHYEYATDRQRARQILQEIFDK